ncbi:MAG TPA: cell division protein FtsA [Candidatus Paceibacterota bacterium]|nr:cell division protein FtsA [Candidatus Paceibacterota bacterium]
MARKQIVAGIDVGNLFVKAAIAELDQETGRPKIIGVGVAESHGLRRGVVHNLDETIRDIGQAIHQAQTMAGTRVGRAYVAVNGPHLRSQISRGVIAVSRADNEIDQSDVERVVEAASIVNLPANREIIHVMPRNFTIDNQEVVKNPLGMKGYRLEAEVLLIDGLSPYIKNLAKCVNANDIEVAGFVYSPLAASYAVLDKKQKEHGVLKVDLGGGLSTLSFFNEGDLVYAATLPIGAQHITHDLAVALRTTVEQAEAVKLQYGFTGSHSAGKKENIDLSTLLEDENMIIPRKSLGRIIDDRVDEVFGLLQNELKRIPNLGIVPSGVVIIGGGARFAGLAGFAKERLKLPVRIGGHPELAGLADTVNDPALAVATGLVLYGLEKDYSGKNTGGSGQLSGSLRKLKGWLKNFLP